MMGIAAGKRWMCAALLAVGLLAITAAAVGDIWPPPGLEDPNGDGRSDQADVDVLCANLGPPGDYWICDYDGDGDIDEIDVIYFIEHYIEIQDGSGRRGSKRGDFNVDGIVNATDLAIMKASFGQGGIGYASGNANCDDLVNATDLALLKTNFAFVAPTAAVPEPATLAAMAVGAIALLRQGRRK